MKKDGGPAFPSPTEFHDGMSLRDYFAGQALVGLIPLYAQGDASRWAETLAIGAYLYADAMLAEREKGQ